MPVRVLRTDRMGESPELWVHPATRSYDPRTTMSQVPETSSRYAMRRTVSLDLPTAEARLRDALAGEGFGVLTEIDLEATLAAKLGVQTGAYRILGACNPAFAKDAIDHDRDIGLLLPCNVILYAGDDPDTTTVAAIDPVVQMGVASAELAPVAEEVRRRLAGVLERIE